jgi:hypothetical protein
VFDQECEECGETPEVLPSSSLLAFYTIKKAALSSQFANKVVKVQVKIHNVE